MRQSRTLLSNEELAALIASSVQIDRERKTGLRATAARILKQIADRLAGQKLS